MAVISAAALIRGRWVVGTGIQLEKRHPEPPQAPAISQTSHHISHKPQQMKLMCRRQSGFMLPPRSPSPPVLAFQCFAWPGKAVWKSRPGHLLLFYHSVLIVYECIYDMEQQNAFHLLCKCGRFSQTWSRICNVSLLLIITCSTNSHSHHYTLISSTVRMNITSYSDGLFFIISIRCT